MDIAASITSGDIGRLCEMAVAAEAGGADRIHLDIEDGVFIPTFTVGPDAVPAVRRATRLPLEVHLQTVDPNRWIAAIASGNADRVIFHLEGTRDALLLIRGIRQTGASAGLALLLDTPVDAVAPWLDQVDQVTVMSTQPQPRSSYDPQALDKVRALAGRVAGIELDGGVTSEIIPPAARAGVTAVAVGRAIFAQGVGRIAAAIAALRREGEL
jgi:ribulose-phosphate 3-epimerase